ncbi:MAG: hypothetical protein Fur0018_02280 [Anaerolineales bacterium]
MKPHQIAVPDSPRIEGGRATLIWEGESPPRVICDLYGWESNPQEMRRLSPGVWAFSFDLPADAYMEYAFLDSNGQRVRDPHNPRRVANGLGDFNHYFYMPEAQPSPWLLRRRGVPHGRLTRHDIPSGWLTASPRRRVYLYRPPVDVPVPLVVVYDGADYLRRARITTIVDHLVAAGRIPPLALALVANGRQARFVEYACSEATLGLLTQHVLPLAQREMPLLQKPGAHAVLGASMGGLQAVYTALRLPHIFGAAISQSGAFAIREQHFVLDDLVQYLPPPPVRLWMDVGQWEFLLAANRQFRERLAARGYTLWYREYNGGHNYTAWRNELPEALMQVFGG